MKPEPAATQQVGGSLGCCPIAARREPPKENVAASFCSVPAGSVSTSLGPGGPCSPVGPVVLPSPASPFRPASPLLPLGPVSPFGPCAPSAPAAPVSPRAPV